MISSKRIRLGMKKFILILGLFLICLAFSSTKIVDIKAAGEYVLTASDVTYSDNGDGTITITDYVNPTEKNIAIPNTIDGKTVTTIGSNAFTMKSLESVEIPETITIIGYRAFTSNRLTSVLIPNSVTTIGDYAFEANWLTSIVIPNSVITIGDFAFSHNNLTSVVIPDSVTTIGYSSFNDNSITTVNGLSSDGIIFARNEDGTDDDTTIVSYGGISNVVDFIPNSVTTIGRYAFGWNNLTSVVIPDSIKTIGGSAFSSNNLTSVVIPNSVTTIGDFAFSSNSLTSVAIPDSITTIRRNAFAWNNLTSVVIPDSVITIEIQAFDGNDLKSVILGNSIKKIGSLAFANNSELQPIMLPGTTDGKFWVDGNGVIVSEITDFASYFTIAGEYVLTVSDIRYIDNGDGTVTITDYINSTEKNITIPNTIAGKPVTAIGERAFSGNNLTIAVIGNSVTTIGERAFFDNNLKSVVIGNSVTTIGEYAFRYNNLKSIVIGNSVTTIGVGAFNLNSITTVNGQSSDGIIFARNEDGTEDYTTIVSYGGISNVVDFIPNTVTTIGERAFYNTFLTNVVIPDSVTTIGVGAFKENNLTSVVIGNSVTTIGASAFRENYSLTSVVIGNSVKTIGDSAFSDNQLSSVVIPDSVTIIGDYAFWCNGLTSVTIGNSVTSIGDYAFHDNNLTIVVIPDSITIIGTNAFTFNDLTSVTIGKSVTIIGDSAFRGSNLTTVVIPDSVTIIGDSAFNGNDLTSVVIPNSVTTIGSDAFNGNSITTVNGLSSDGIIFARNEDGTEDCTTIVSYGGISNIIDFIPNAVTTIGDSAFRSNNLTSVVIPDSVTTIGDSAFRSNDLTIVVIPDNVTTIGSGAFSSNKLTSVVIPNSVTTIGDSAFIGNDLTSVLIPNNVTTIGDSAFQYNRLTSVVIPDSITSIGESAFESNNLTNLTIGNSVTTIGRRAFAWNNLTTVVIPDSVTTIGYYSFGGNSELQPIVLPASDGELWVDWNGVIVSEIINQRNIFTKYSVSFNIDVANLNVEIGSNNGLPTYTACLDSSNGQTIDISDSVMISGYVNTDMPGTYELVYTLQYEGYTEEHKVEVRVIDTRPPKYYRLQDQLIYIDTELDWTNLVGRIWSSSDEVLINVIGNVNIKEIGENELKIIVEDCYDNKVDNNVKVYVSNSRDDFKKLTYRLNNNRRMEYDIKKEVGYYDNYKLNIEYLINNVDFENVGTYEVVIRTYSVLRAVRIETFLIEIVE